VGAAVESVRALSINPSSDMATTAYIWLAVMNFDQKRVAEARADIREALSLEPDRLHAQIVNRHVVAGRAK
jgi:Tfp pilus assembly protein PilF